MAVINWSLPMGLVGPYVDLSALVEGIELTHQEGYSGNRLTDREVVVENVPRPVFIERVGAVPKRVQVNKTTHRIRFENESESQVTVVIEPKEAE